jgi:DNA repair exonuclease SbcCD ATPase subunit
MQTNVLFRAVSSFNKLIESPQPVTISTTATETLDETNDNDTDESGEADIGCSRDDLVQENKYLRNELTLLCQRLIELEEADRQLNSLPSIKDTSAMHVSSTNSLSVDFENPSEPIITAGHATVGTAMLQIQKLEDDLHRERLLSKELQLQISRQESTIINTEDMIASLKQKLDNLASLPQVVLSLSTQVQWQSMKLKALHEKLMNKDSQLHKRQKDYDELMETLLACRVDVDINVSVIHHLRDQLTSE